MWPQNRHNRHLVRPVRMGVRHSLPISHTLRGVLSERAAWTRPAVDSRWLTCLSSERSSLLSAARPVAADLLAVSFSALGRCRTPVAASSARTSHKPSLGQPVSCATGSIQIEEVNSSATNGEAKPTQDHSMPSATGYLVRTDVGVPFLDLRRPQVASRFDHKQRNTRQFMAHRGSSRAVRAHWNAKWARRLTG